MKRPLGTHVPILGVQQDAKKFVDEKYVFRQNSYQNRVFLFEAQYFCLKFNSSDVTYKIYFQVDVDIHPHKRKDMAAQLPGG